MSQFVLEFCLNKTSVNQAFAVGYGLFFSEVLSKVDNIQVKGGLIKKLSVVKQNLKTNLF